MGTLTTLSPASYAAHRGSIKSGDILAWAGRGPLSMLVRRWTGETYSHVGIAWVVGGRVLVLEAMLGRGVVALPLSAQLKSGCYWIPTGANWSESALRSAIDRLGEDYSVVNDILVGLGLHPMKQGLECAQYAIDVLASAGIPLNCAATPGALVNALLHRG